MDVTKPYESIGFGAMDVTKPDEGRGEGTKTKTQLYVRSNKKANSEIPPDPAPKPGFLTEHDSPDSPLGPRGRGDKNKIKGVLKNNWAIRDPFEPSY